jgi:hypothetical protein
LLNGSLNPLLCRELLDFIPLFANFPSAVSLRPMTWKVRPEMQPGVFPGDDTADTSTQEVL